MSRKYNRYVPEMLNELQLQFYLKDLLEDNDYDVEIEKWTDGEEKRIDILAKNGINIGIETKFWSGSRSAVSVSELEKQVFDYMGETFDGQYIDIWAVAPYYEEIDKIEPSQKYIKHLCNEMGIGYINLDRPHIFADFMHSDENAKIYFGQQSDENALKQNIEEQKYETDIQHIIELIEKKIPVWLKESIGEDDTKVTA